MCTVGRLPIRFTVGTGGTIRMQARAGMMMKLSLASTALWTTAFKSSLKACMSRWQCVSEKMGMFSLGMDLFYL